MQVLQISVPQLIGIFGLDIWLISTDLSDEFIQLLLFILINVWYILLLNLLPVFFHLFEQFVPFNTGILWLLFDLFLDHRMIPATEVQLILFVSQRDLFLAVFEVGQFLFLKLVANHLVLIFVLFQFINVNGTFGLFDLRQDAHYLLLLLLLFLLLEFYVLLLVQWNPFSIFGKELLEISLSL